MCQAWERKQPNLYIISYINSMTLASYITLLRIFLIFPVVLLISKHQSYLNIVALALFVIAAITDYLDGYVARKTNKESPLGALLDLLADKLLVCITLIWLTFIFQQIYLTIPVIFIISRELVISSLRQFVVERIGQNPINVLPIGKSKTTLQLISISFLIISPNLGSFFYSITIILLWISALISLYSLISYSRAYKNFF